MNPYIIVLTNKIAFFYIIKVEKKNNNNKKHVRLRTTCERHTENYVITLHRTKTKGAVSHYKT